MDGPQLRTIRKALAVLEGSKARLAAALALPIDELNSYLEGAKPLPHVVFMDALDIVAGRNGNAPERR